MVRSGGPPLWLEARAPLERVRLHRHPLLGGDGAPAGAGRPVVLVPGFLAGDRSLATLRDWLVRLGYRVAQPGIAWNVRYSEAELRTLLPCVAGLAASAGGPVTIVGHSRGGLLAKVLADRHPELVAHVVGLGSPFAAPFDLHPATTAAVRVAVAVNVVRYGHTAGVETRFLRDLARPARVSLTSVYSRSDGIVRWEACLRPDATCLEVAGSHTGLAVNPAVYALLARVLPAPRAA